MDPLRSTFNSAAFSQLNMNNDIRGRIKELVDYPLFFNQCHVVNHLLNPLMCLIRLGYTNKTRMDQVLYYFYKTDEHTK